MAKRRSCMVWRGAVALAGVSLLGTVRAAELRPQDFAAPVYDAVAPGAVQQGLTEYLFLGGHDWPAVRLFTPKPLDWSRFGMLLLPVDNPGNTSFRLLLRIDDHADANGDDRSLTGTIDIPPHAQGNVLLPLDAAPVGMVARPPTGGTASPGDLIVRQVRGAVDLGHVTALHVSGVRGEADRKLRLGNPTLRLATPIRRGPLSDAFGQAIDGRWPEKVASLVDLKAKLHQADAQTQQLAEKTYVKADRYGGVDPDTKLPATGTFRSEKKDGRWSLITPAGHRFFSLGVDAVVPANPTVVAGRRGLFGWLPEPHDPLFAYAALDPKGNIDSYDFGRADLDRGLGTNWVSAWRDQAVRRLKSWNFNTLGNWSAGDLTGAGALPYVAMDEVGGDLASVPMPGRRSMPDPFDPRFAASADAFAARMTRQHLDDPMLIGYFSGNELPWGSDDHPEQGLVAQILWLDAGSPAKRALIDSLRRRYDTPDAFASAWGIDKASSWDDFLKRRIAWPSALGPAAKRDIGEFEGVFATLYFNTVSLAIKRYDPRHLYLGTRFADAPSSVVEACSRWCDVLSFNVYGNSPAIRAAAWRPFDKPVLIGEFHFGSTDRGSFWPGMVDAGVEAERGHAYSTYVSEAVEDRQIVGVHWFQYADEPLTGRPYDGENGHIGLVAVTNVPYAAFVAEAAAANGRAMGAFAPFDGLELRGTQ